MGSESQCAIAARVRRARRFVAKFAVSAEKIFGPLTCCSTIALAPVRFAQARKTCQSSMPSYKAGEGGRGGGGKWGRGSRNAEVMRPASR